MTLDEAIKHAEEVAIEQDKLCKRYDDASGYSRSHNEAIRTTEAKRCEKCAKEHLQLAAWLEDYQRLLEEQLVDDAKKHFEIICKLSQACGMTYSYVEEKIRGTEKALLEASLQGPFEDTVSRQAVLDFIRDNYRRWFINDDAFMQCMNEIKVMMSTPKKQEAAE